jgi:hypothetical protein
MKGKWRLAIAAALVLALNASASAASPTLYVGDTKEYAVAFKTEDAQLYVIELAGATECYYTEPHEDLGAGFFSAFAAPKLMRGNSEGLGAEDFGRGNASVSAKLAGDSVSGDFRYSESELSYHCDTGFQSKPFQAARYQPAAVGGVPVNDERPVYFGGEASTEVFLRAGEASTEVFLRAGEREAFGIRGTFVPSCRVGRGKRILARHALFSEPVNAKLGEGRSFEKEDVEQGTTRAGARYRETISLIGSVDQGAATGTYLRVRVIKPRHKTARRCVNGPLPFRAVRYLRALG